MKRTVAQTMAWAVAAWGLAAGAEAQTHSYALSLEEVLDSALATHPALDMGRAGVDAARASVGEAQAGWWPAVSATGLARRYEEPMVVAPLHGFDPQRPPVFDRTLIQGHAVAEWTLYDGGLTRWRSRGAEGLADAAAAGLDVARDAVIVEVVTAYLGALTAEAVLAAHDGMVASLEAERDRSARLYDQGRAPRVQLLRVEAALSRTVADRESASARRELALRRLARVSGLPWERVQGGSLAGFEPSAAPPGERGTLVESALAESPALERASARAAAAEAAVAAARSQWLPRLSLGAAYSAFGGSDRRFAPEWNVGAQVSYPLFVGGARSRGVERAASEAWAARAEAAVVAREVEDAVDAALVELRSATARVVALDAAVERSLEVARIEALALETGAGMQTDYLRAEAELLAARAERAEAGASLAGARVALARATGRLSAERVVELLKEDGQ
jgi:outer membrane protein